MKKWIKKSFHRQLLVCFGVVALLPLLLFGVSLIQTMETKINSDYEKKVTEQAEQIDAGILELFQEFETVVENINANTRIVDQIGEDDTWSKSKIYLQFYREVTDYREYAQFDLYDKNGKCIYTTAQGSAKRDLPVYWGILKAVEDSKETLVLRRADTNDSKILLYAAGKLMGKDGIPEGYIVISMRAENFEKVLHDKGNAKAEVAIMDPFWRTIYDNGNLQTDQIRQELMSGHKLLGVYRAGELLIQPLGESGLYTVMACPSVFSREVLSSMYRVLTVMLTISVLLCVIVASRVGRNMTKPIERMNTAMRTLQEGDLSVRIASDREDELGQMSRNFNIMANELEQSVQDKVEKQKELNASHIAMMQAQLNPHFLYNTLEIIRSRAMRRGSEDVAEMAEALGMLFRYCINSPGELATLAQELDNVHHYLLIQRYRYGDRFTYEEHIENEDVMDSSLPVMTLQPLVENALSHGINRRVDGGKITMRVESIGSRLQISVEDNGVGIAEDELRRVRKSLRERSGPIERRADSSRSTGIALRNVNRRIQFYFGMQYGVDVASTQDIGTTVIVTLPQMRGN